MNPHRRDEVLAGLSDAQATWTAYAQALPLETFFQAPSPGRWAPITHLRHLTLTHRRVTQGLSTPRPVLRVTINLLPKSPPATSKTRCARSSTTGVVLTVVSEII